MGGTADSMRRRLSRASAPAWHLEKAPSWGGGGGDGSEGGGGGDLGRGSSGSLWEQGQEAAAAAAVAGFGAGAATGASSLAGGSPEGSVGGSMHGVALGRLPPLPEHEQMLAPAAELQQRGASPGLPLGAAAGSEEGQGEQMHSVLVVSDREQGLGGGDCSGLEAAGGGDAVATVSASHGGSAGQQYEWQLQQPVRTDHPHQQQQQQQQAPMDSIGRLTTEAALAMLEAVRLEDQDAAMMAAGGSSGGGGSGGGGGSTARVDEGHAAVLRELRALRAEMAALLAAPPPH